MRAHRWLPALLLAALVASPGRAAAVDDADAVPTYELTAREKAAARTIADAHLAAAASETASGSEGKAAEVKPAATVTHFVGAELYRDKAIAARLARVIYYRPAGDLTLYVIVNLDAGRALKLETAAHVPTALSSAEFEQARALALADPAVKAALGDVAGQVVVEPMQVRSLLPGTPDFGRRIVRLLFKVDRDYLSEPVVMVDLNAGSVRIVPSEPWKVGK